MTATTTFVATRQQYIGEIAAGMGVDHEALAERYRKDPAEVRVDNTLRDNIMADLEDSRLFENSEQAETVRLALLEEVKEAKRALRTAFNREDQNREQFVRWARAQRRIKKLDAENDEIFKAIVAVNEIPCPALAEDSK